LQGVGWQTPPRQEEPKHVAHWAPPPPQALGSLPGWHAPFSSQQPRAQLVASQVESKHVPFSHCELTLHRAQAAPKLPQAPSVSPPWQAPLPSQHPFGHVLSLQVEPTHAPVWQIAPTTHSAQAAPPVPHAVTRVPASHAPVAPQQPFGQLAAEHVPWQAPPSHVAPIAHFAQRLPAVPQTWFVDPVWQVPLASQQPVGHVWELHVGVPQPPPSHAVPGGHAKQELPSTPHTPWLDPGWQTLFWSQHPRHVPSSQLGTWHWPPEQVPIGPQLKQPTPPIPHATGDSLV